MGRANPFLGLHSRWSSQIRFLICSILMVGLLLASQLSMAQVKDSCGVTNAVKDSLTISAVEDASGKDKVLHAEPLYVDLIRDLGARKGEQELNVAWGMQDHSSYTAYEALVEYEWAPIDRLGLEIEVPLYVYSNNELIDLEPTPPNRLDGLKLAAQYSFYVSEKHQTSLAVGYIQQLVAPDLDRFSMNTVLTGLIYNPFLVAARRFGNNWHTLVYAGPRLYQTLAGEGYNSTFATNVNLHYMVTGTRNYLGLEMNHEVNTTGQYLTLRPQMRLEINDQIMLGVVTTLPVASKFDRMGAFFRLIYEPHWQKRKQ